MTEVWKNIAGYDGLYQVSNLGNVKSLNYGRTGKKSILISRLMKNGYLFVTLCKDKKHKNYTVHRLVAEAFILNPNGYPCVNHKDENKLNNCVENLEWCTYSYNTVYSCAKPIYCIELDKVFPSAKEAGKFTDINDCNINSCLKGRQKSAGGYHWRYA